MPATPRRSIGSADDRRRHLSRLSSTGGRCARGVSAHISAHRRSTALSTGRCGRGRTAAIPRDRECDCFPAPDVIHRASLRRLAALVQARVELRPRMLGAAMRAKGLRDGIGNELERVPIGFDAGGKFPARHRAANHQCAHVAPVSRRINDLTIRRHPSPSVSIKEHCGAILVPPLRRRRAGRSPRSSRPGSRSPYRRCRRRCRGRPRRTGSGCRSRRRPTG